MDAVSLRKDDQDFDILIQTASDLLYRLGVTENYKGFHYAAYAAALAATEQDCLLLVTKRLYPDVARRFGTTRFAVERNLRTVISVAWKHNPLFLSCLAQQCLECAPSCTHFIAILAHYLKPFADNSAIFP